MAEIGQVVGVCVRGQIQSAHFGAQLCGKVYGLGIVMKSRVGNENCNGRDGCVRHRVGPVGSALVAGLRTILPSRM